MAASAYLSVKLAAMDLFWFEDREEMPKELYTEEGKPFETCKQCGKSLLQPPVGYTLEKVFKRYPNVAEPQVLLSMPFVMIVPEICAMNSLKKVPKTCKIILRKASWAAMMQKNRIYTHV